MTLFGTTFTRYFQPILAHDLHVGKKFDRLLLRVSYSRKEFLFITRRYLRISVATASLVHTKQLGDIYRTSQLALALLLYASASKF